jgi:hypothetical protein
MKKSKTLTSREYKEQACNPEELFDPETSVVEKDEEIVVHWVNKHGIEMDIKTRRGGLIHALWMAEHEKRSRKRVTNEEQPIILDVECQVKQLPDADQSSP